ncbi:DNA-binding protein [Paracoccus sp. (in: a-proteobacteria)]|uniref:DNA-binding protein n=1 Tax=Paracoccus sp. TaxID=267 RepID=UPI0026E0397C|nr:DNA-binding protein [Paracoccus sp. (in: a-proteobacteria)]MDO5647655.1 DNA-binding protein [Paracoccus sp. (in: a-proteobacteria)]
MKSGNSSTGRALDDPGSDGSPRTAKVLQKRAFVDRVVAETGIPRGQALPVIDATLAQLGLAMAQGMTLAVPPLGRARVTIDHSDDGNDVVTMRLRRPRAKG